MKTQKSIKDREQFVQSVRTVTKIYQDDGYISYDSSRPVKGETTKVGTSFAGQVVFFLLVAVGMAACCVGPGLLIELLGI